MTEKVRIPQIRFKGFTDPWEQCKLSDVVQITMGQSPDGSTYSDTPSDYILVQGNADLENGWVKPRMWTTQKTKICNAGDLIMSVRAPAGNMGKTLYNAVIGRGVAAIKGNEFIYQTLVKMDNDGYWKTLSCGSTFESLNSDNIKNAEISVPPNTEQIKIGNIFENLDNLITLHQRKHDKLVNVKKSLLEKMFPSDGEKVPKIRFKGFTDPWEQCKLSQLGRIETGNTPSTAIEEYYSDTGLLWVTPTDIISNILVNTDKKLSTKGISVARVIPANSILCTCIASIGKNAFLPVKCAFNQQINALTPFDNNYPYFLFTDSYHWSQTMKKGAGGLTFQIVNKTDFSNIKTNIPKYEEQKLIGKMFYVIDNLITLHQSKLEKLKNIKKSLLEKMFV